jgi:hypothetical protein
MVAVAVTYLLQVIRGSSIPNPATWFIWLVVMVLNTVTYYFVSKRNVWVVLTPSIITLGMLVILGYSTYTGRIGKVKRVEVVCFLLAVVVGTFWLTTRKAVISNLMMQIVLAISFVPTIIGLLKGELREKALPWNLAVLSYCFLIASILVGSEWTWVQLAFPAVNGIVGNGSVALITKFKS